jgi:hypothetical protein
MALRIEDFEIMVFSLIQKGQQYSQDLEAAFSVIPANPVLKSFSPRPLRLCGECLLEKTAAAYLTGWIV